MPSFRKYWVELDDELPAIGSGFRTVEAYEGRKWTRVRLHANVNATRIRTSRWDMIPHVPVDGGRSPTLALAQYHPPERKIPNATSTSGRRAPRGRSRAPRV
jgi:hypothetical protein